MGQVIPKEFAHHTKGIDNNVQKWEYLFVDTNTFLMNVYGEKPHYAKSLLKRLHSRMFLIQAEEYPDILSVLDLILEEMEKQEELYKENVCSMLVVLLQKLLRLNKRENIEENQKNDTANLGSIVEVINYINHHYDSEIRIGELAKLSKMSETHFRRVFSEYMNISPVEYINLVRIEKACELMRKSDEKIEDIAAKVGFPVATTFSRNFKKITGYSPIQWKSLMKKEENIFLDYKISVLKGW